MSGYGFTDTHTTIADTPDHITAAVPGIKPSSAVLTDFITATKGVAVRVAILRATCAGAADTYSVYRLASAGTPSTTNVIFADIPLNAGEAHALDNIIVNPGDKLVVSSANGRIAFSADIGEEP